MTKENIDVELLSAFFGENEKNSVERISTLNHMGGMIRNFDEITKKFIKYSVSNKSNSNFKILELGAAYGDVALECLKKGVNNYLINDLDERHLEVFKLRAKLENINKETFKVVAGDFLDNIALHPFYDAILISRVMHFFEPDKWLQALNKLFYLLKPGGKVFVSVISPYVKPFTPFIENYLKQKKEGVLFPGFIDDIFTELNIPRTIELSRDPNNHFPKLNLMCADLLACHFKKVGFEIIKTYEFPFMYESTIWQLGGRESAGLIAAKENKFNELRVKLGQDKA